MLASRTKETWTDEEDETNPILFYITAEHVQEFAECNLGRRLDDVELDRAARALYEADEFYFIGDTLHGVLD